MKSPSSKTFRGGQNAHLISSFKIVKCFNYKSSSFLGTHKLLGVILVLQLAPQA